MINPNIVYNATGRYMDGQKVTAYHLVGIDGSQAKENKETVIRMIGRGLISNMRIQVGKDDEIIIRGNGINLNKLPVFDENKQKIRDGSTDSSIKNMGQYKILKRIMYKNQCLGYELQDCSGAISRKQRDKVIELASKKLIANAVVQRYNRNNDGNYEYVLRGVNIELNKLPILIVNSSGKIVDPCKDASGITFRAVYMKGSGVIRDRSRNKMHPFKAGDFIIVQCDGSISIKSGFEVKNKYNKDTESNCATCDFHISAKDIYTVEMFGNREVEITIKDIKKWSIIKLKSS